MKPWRSSVPAVAVMLLAGWAMSAAFAQSGDAQEAVVGGVTTSAPTEPPLPEDAYGLWVLIPPALTIVLAIAFRQVIPALAVGILTGAYMLVRCRVPEDAYGGGVVGGLRLAVETYLIGALADVDHIKILLFTSTIGAMVGVIAANGGTRAVVEIVARWASTRQRGQIATWFAGMVVFFDDYANAMIVGPSMRPVLDKLKVSRAKLAYIVDSTAAPVASIALIGTWVGAEIGFIKDRLQEIKESADAPAFLENISGYSAFMWSIPYRFYPILALVMVVLIAVLGRDFGPMRRHEDEAETASDGRTADRGDLQPAGEKVGRAWYAIAPVLALIATTLALLWTTGLPAEGFDSVELLKNVPPWYAKAEYVISNADPYNSILYGAYAGVLAAVIITLATGSLGIGKTVDAATDVVSRMLPTFIVLILAWALSGVMKDLHLGQVAVGHLKEYPFAIKWLPLLIFISACVVSFATGTSWGTMGILCPATVTIAAGMFADLPVEQAQAMFYASIGAVLAGAVFGDHCSPISDTTVLSSLASECSLEVHVWTQIPYALTVAAVSILCGDVLCRQFDQPAWVGLAAGTAALFVIVMAIGRRPRAAT